MGSWLNADSLFLKFGTDKTTANKGGEYRNNEKYRTIDFLIDLTTLTETETPLSDTVFMPAGARIQDVVVTTQTVAATGVAIDLGLVRTDRTTEIDFNGLLAAFPVAQMSTAGERDIIQQEVTVPVSMVGLGALIGATVGVNPGYITCSRTTATAFTSGVIHVQIHYFMP